MNVPGKILIVRPDRLGDLILSLPVAEVLKREFPSSEVSYLASPYTCAISPMVTYVDEWIADDDGTGEPLCPLKLARRIKPYRFDCLIELKPSWRTAFGGFLSGVKTRIGTSRRAYSIFYNKRLKIHRRESGFHQADLELRHLAPLGIDISGANPTLRGSETGRLQAAKLLGEIQRFIVIHPGSGGSAPNWPLDKYRGLAKRIAAETDYSVVITDSKGGLSGFEGCLDLGGKTDLETLAGILAGARLFISGSTGPLHMADALGIPCIAFFSNRADLGPERWGPRRNMDNILMTGEICHCGKASDCRCLESITVDMAFAKVMSVLNFGSKAVS